MNWWSRSRIQGLALAAGTTTRFGAGILMGTGLAIIIEEAGGSPFLVSSLFTAYFLGMTVMSPVWGAIADVTGRRRLLLVLTGLGATGSILTLRYVDNLWWLVGLRGVYAVFAVSFSPIVLAIVSQQGGEAGRGKAMGFFNSARSGGFALGQLTVGLLLGLVLPDQLYLIIAGVSLLSTVLIVLIADPTPTHDRLDMNTLYREIKTRLVPRSEHRGHLKTDGLQWLYVALAVRNMTVLGVMSVLPIYLTGQVGTSYAMMGVLLAINPVAQVGCMAMLGRIADDMGRKPLIIGGMFLSGLFALLEAGAGMARPGIDILIAGAGLLSLALGFSAMTIGALSFIGDVAPADRESELMGLRSTAKGVGGLIGPLLIGAMATVFGFIASFALASGLGILAAVIVYSQVRESHPADITGVPIAFGD